MSWLKRRRTVVLVLLIIVLGLFVLRPGANGLRRRIVNSVSLALGRKVDVQWVKLRVLPAPAFELINFVVYDDPAFSAEPMLRAQEVTAILRLRSLLRGRIEIGRLSLKEPSFNLVRGEDGHWNVESLIDRAVHTEAAPTQNPRPGRRPVFPYVEADDGRINFKIGLEKKSYTLTDADFALWLESNDQWGMRLVAQPLRTDFNLSDTGVLKVNGTWQRSRTLRETPVKFTLRWDGGQAGQLSKLFYGKDFGWRGGLAVYSEISGTPAALRINFKGSLDDFRRYDIVPDQGLRLQTSCAAVYSSIDHAISNVACTSPIGNGKVTLTGRIGAPTGPRTYDLSLDLDDVPTQALVSLLQRAKKDVPTDLVATGTLGGSFSVRKTAAGSSPAWSGAGHTQRSSLRSPAAKIELLVGTVPFNVHSESRETIDAEKRPPSPARLDIGPFTIAAAKQLSALAQGWASTTGYDFSVQGDGALQSLLATARMAGVQTPQLKADGAAKFNFALVGPWSGFAPPRPTGILQLHGVQAQVPGLSGKVNIRSATLALSPDSTHGDQIVASAAGSVWQGSLSLPRPCHIVDDCPIHFDLHSDAVDAGALRRWFSPARRKSPWYSFVAAGNGAIPAGRGINATGTLEVARLNIKGLTAKHVACRVEFRDRLLHVSKLSAEFLGGKHHGEWTANLAVDPPEVVGTGEFDAIRLAELAEAMHDGWITGAGKGRYRFEARGRSMQEWFRSGKGSLNFEIRDGSLPHVVIASDKGALRVHRFNGTLSLEDGTFAFSDSKLQSGEATYNVTGSVVSAQKLQIRLTHSGGGFLIAGPLSAPQVTATTVTETRAALKQ